MRNFSDALMLASSLHFLDAEHLQPQACSRCEVAVLGQLRRDRKRTSAVLGNLGTGKSRLGPFSRNAHGMAVLRRVMPPLRSRTCDDPHMPPNSLRNFSGVRGRAAQHWSQVQSARQRRNRPPSCGNCRRFVFPPPARRPILVTPVRSCRPKKTISQKAIATRPNESSPSDKLSALNLSESERLSFLAGHEGSR